MAAYNGSNFYTFIIIYGRRKMESMEKTWVLTCVCAAILFSVIAIAYNWRMAVEAKAEFAYKTACVMASGNVQK